MFSITKIKAAWETIQLGKELANATAWRDHQITANKIAAFIAALVALAATFGYHIPIDHELADAIGVVLLAAGNGLLTAGTNSDVGLSGRKVQVPEDEHRTMSNGDNPILPGPATAEVVQLRTQTDGLMADDRDGIPSQ